MLRSLRLIVAPSVALLVLITGCSTEQPLATFPSRSPLPFKNTISAATEVQKTNPNIQRIERGKQIFRNMQSSSSATVEIFGSMTDKVYLLLSIPEQYWNNLSKETQVDLTFYIESLVPDVQAHPSRYSDISFTAPGYNLVLNNISNICDGCWKIMEITSDGGDKVAVQGDQGWEKDEIKEGVKASEFRNKDFENNSITSTTERPATEPSLRASISPTVVATSSPSANPDAQDICNRPYQALYLDIYLQCIHEGMSHAEVSAVVGNPGEEVSSAGATVIYQWHGAPTPEHISQDASAIMTVTFQDDKVVAKSQVGLVN